ncbi:MAG: biopolymer transporter ExbD [Planctomycetaceae bacterium]|nr:biopolymer transporter ExbD [Planctomycetaceae bacterium]
MKRRQPPPSIPRIDMTPMIDVVFQLLIFFMLTLKIVTQEGNFDIHMPLGQAGKGAQDKTLPELKVRLIAQPDGSLGMVQFGQRSLGNGQPAFDRLNEEIIRLIGHPGSPLAQETEVELDADYGLDYRYIIQAITAVSGRFDPVSREVVRYVDKVKFAPPRKPSAP